MPKRHNHRDLGAAPLPPRCHREFSNGSTNATFLAACNRVPECRAFRAAEKPEPPKPSSRTVRKIEGWTVRIDDRLLQPPNVELGSRCLKSLEARLADINAVVRPDRLEKLHAVTIVLDLSHGKLTGAQYHPDADWLVENGYSPTWSTAYTCPAPRSFSNRGKSTCSRGTSCTSLPMPITTRYWASTTSPHPQSLRKLQKERPRRQGFVGNRRARAALWPDQRRRSSSPK